MNTFKSLRWAALAGFGVIVLAVGMMGASVATGDQEQRRGEGFRGRGPGGGGGDRMGAMAEDLNLSAEQKAFFDDVQAVKKEKRQARRAMRGEAALLDDMMDGGIDARSIHMDIDEKFETARGKAHEAADARIAFLNSLDDTQLALLDEKRAERAERKKDKRQKRGKRGRRGPGGQGGPQGEVAQ